MAGMKDDTTDWISQQVPDGTDWLEYMLVKGPEKTGDSGVDVAGHAGRARSLLFRSDEDATGGDLAV
jgi:hypothetical protein